MGDPVTDCIKRYGWSGVLVEPVPYLFEELVRNYRGFDGLRFERVAIAEEAATKAFFFLNEHADGLPNWLRGVGSFNSESLLGWKNSYPELERLLETVQVNCLPLRALVERHALHDCHVLVTDTEGFDYMILKQIPDALIDPEIVLAGSRIRHL
jgi:FkbM family methyltransferase